MIRRVRLPAVAVVLLSLARAADFNAASATNQAGLDLYGELAASRPGKNFIVSPYSIESALALAYAGADGTTRDEMATALHFPPDEPTVREAFAALRAALEKLATESAKIAETRSRDGPQVHAIVGGKRVELQGEPAPAIEWHEANRLFAQSGYAFRDSFLALMRDGYAAPFAPLDFRRDSEKARGVINDWVQAQTQDKIHDLIPGGGVNGDTRLVLVNALYLKAPWDVPFEKTFTVPEPFHLPGGDTRDVPTMRRGAYLGYAHDDRLTVVALDYIGREL